MSLPVQQIVTFATEPFRGNPAFVVTLDKPRPVSVLQSICRELHDGVLAVLSIDGDEVDLRFVTPRGTHQGPGHATHAAAFVALNRLRPGRSIDLRIEGGGHRSARIEDDMLSVDWPVMPFVDIDRIDALRDCFGRAPLSTYDSSFGLIAIFHDHQEVAALKPDFAKLTGLSSDTVIVTAPATAADFAIRVFAPKLDLPEDPVCGTAHRILVPFWAQQFGRQALVSHQLSERGGELHCRLNGDIVTIGGRAVPFLDGTINLPD